MPRQTITRCMHNHSALLTISRGLLSPWTRRLPWLRLPNSYFFLSTPTPRRSEMSSRPISDQNFGRSRDWLEVVCASPSGELVVRDGRVSREAPPQARCCRRPKMFFGFGEVASGEDERLVKVKRPEVRSEPEPSCQMYTKNVTTAASRQQGNRLLTPRLILLLM